MPSFRSEDLIRQVLLQGRQVSTGRKTTNRAETTKRHGFSNTN